MSDRPLPSQYCPICGVAVESEFELVAAVGVPQHVCQEMETDDSEPDMGEPVGSCEECGTNLYEEDGDYLCDMCAWYAEQWWREE